MAHPTESPSSVGGPTGSDAPGGDERRPPRGREEERAADTLPQAGLAFRGGFGDQDRAVFRVGATYRHAGLLRASRDVRVATDNFADRDVVALYGRDSRDISAGSDAREDALDAETVFWPDPVFTVVAQTELDDRVDARLEDGLADRPAGRTSGQRPEPTLADRPLLTVLVVHGEKADPQTDVRDAVERVAHAIAGARQIGPATIPHPGRYRGPIGVDANGRLAPQDGGP